MRIIENVALHAMERLQATYQGIVEYNKQNILTDNNDIIEKKLLLVNQFLNQFASYLKEER